MGTSSALRAARCCRRDGYVRWYEMYVTVGFRAMHLLKMTWLGQERV